MPTLQNILAYSPFTKKLMTVLNYLPILLFVWNEFNLLSTAAIYSQSNTDKSNFEL